MSNRFRYISPRGEEIEFSGTAPWFFDNEAGLITSSASPITRRAPGQRGSTVLDALAEPKLVQLTVEIRGESNAEAWALRRALARVFALDGASSDEAFKLGTLQLMLDGQPPVETPCMPVASSAALEWLDAGFTTLSGGLEFYCPTGLWRETTPRIVVLETAGTGLTLPADLPWTITANAATQEIDVISDVRTPLHVRFHGLVDEPRLRNLTTGQVIHVTGAVEAGDFLDVDTDAHTVTLVTSEGHIPVLDRWGWGSAMFWQLLPGVNSVRFESNAGQGSAVITWYPTYFGI